MGLVKNANSVWLIGRPLLADLERRLDREVRIANDANCFASSEAADGAGEGAEIVFGAIVGTGTGAGIVVRGHVVAGPNGIAGEWGHNPMPWPADDERPGPACYCGRHGCIETFLSGPGMQADYERRTGTRRRPGEIVADAAAGERAAQDVLARYEERMARALASIVNVLDPDVIVLGGGMSNIASLYEHVPRLWGPYVFACGADPVGFARTSLTRLAPQDESIRTRLVPARHGDSSGVRGAAWLWPEAGNVANA
jgi:fructokinase